jgi:transcriptional regulator with XRE-family HTH domain
MNINSSLTNELRDKAYRDAYVASQIRVGIPFQVRGLRKQRNLSQGELASLAGMAQPRISEIERPGERNFNIDTLLRLAAGLDVALQISFVPFSKLVDQSESFDPDNFQVPDFETELAQSQEVHTSATLTFTSSTWKEITEQVMPISGSLQALARLGYNPRSQEQAGPQTEMPFATQSPANVIFIDSSTRFKSTEMVHKYSEIECAYTPTASKGPNVAHQSTPPPTYEILTIAK